MVFSKIKFQTWDLESRIKSFYCRREILYCLNIAGSLWLIGSHKKSNETLIRHWGFNGERENPISLVVRSLTWSDGQSGSVVPSRSGFFRLFLLGRFTGHMSPHWSPSFVILHLLVLRPWSSREVGELRISILPPIPPLFISARGRSWSTLPHLASYCEMSYSVSLTLGLAVLFVIITKGFILLFWEFGVISVCYPLLAVWYPVHHWSQRHTRQFHNPVAFL